VEEEVHIGVSVVRYNCIGQGIKKAMLLYPRDRLEVGIK